MNVFMMTAGKFLLTKEATESISLLMGRNNIFVIILVAGRSS
jgi:hypothetical protein